MDGAHITKATSSGSVVVVVADGRGYVSLSCRVVVYDVIKEEGKEGGHCEAKTTGSSARWSLMSHQSSSFDDEDVKLAEDKDGVDLMTGVGVLSPHANASDLLGAYDVEHPDWQAQVTMAEAVLDGYHARSLPQDEEVFVPWAVSEED